MIKAKMTKHGERLNIEFSFDDTRTAVAYFQDKESLEDLIEALSDEPSEDISHLKNEYEKTREELEKSLKELEKSNNPLSRAFAKTVREVVDEIDEYNKKDDAVRD